jgi:competence protein ComFC
MRVLDTVIGWLAPPVCLGCGVEGFSFCFECSIANIIPFGERCFNCNAISVNSATCGKCKNNGPPRHVWVSTDYEGVIKNLVQLYKFGHQRVAAKSIANLMSETFLFFNSNEEILKTNYLVVAVPTATSRVRQRGFDHSALLALAVAKNLKLPYKNVMQRLGQSRQVGKSRTERFKQADGKYVVIKPDIVAGRNILLIDDVVTTGATLCSVTKALRKAGAKRVDALVFAKRL